MQHIFETRSQETGQDLETVLQARASSIPVGRFGRPEELGGFRCLPGIGEEQLRHRHDYISGRRRRAVSDVDAQGHLIGLLP